MSVDSARPRIASQDQHIPKPHMDVPSVSRRSDFSSRRSRQCVTANLLVTFTSDPSSTTRKVVEVEYQAAPGLSLNGVFNQNGGFAADIRIRKTW